MSNDKLFDSIDAFLGGASNEPPITPETTTEPADPTTIKGQIDLLIGDTVELAFGSTLDDAAFAIVKARIDALHARLRAGLLDITDEGPIPIISMLLTRNDNADEAVRDATDRLADLAAVAIFCRVYGGIRSSRPARNGTFLTDQDVRIMQAGNALIGVVRELCNPVQSERIEQKRKEQSE